MLSKDPIATMARCFANKKSYVRFDQSEVLYGNDWKMRVAELLARCGGRCEHMIYSGGTYREDTLERCRSEAADPHHIVKRSKYRDDRLSNLQALCRMHHELLDERVTRFGEKSPVEKRRKA